MDYYIDFYSCYSTCAIYILNPNKVYSAVNGKKMDSFDFNLSFSLQTCQRDTAGEYGEME